MTIPVAIPSAAELRRQMIERQAERARRRAAQDLAARREREEMLDHFLHDRLTKSDLIAARAQILAAAGSGRYEAMIMRFPSDFCTDGGRAVNNDLPGWIDTLPGKAREACALWAKVGRPNGYRLRAMVLNFPDGMPGDIGLFVNWAPLAP
jgi:hypothetical protein